MMSSGVRPIIFFASAPIARIALFPRLPCSFPTATTDGSLMMTPFPGTNTSTLVVPRSMPSFGEKKYIASIVSSSAPRCKDATIAPMEEGVNFIVEGGKRLSGSVETSRSKNGVVALLAASLLNAGRTTFTHVPKIEEVNRLIEVLRSIGVSVEWKDASVVIDVPKKLSLDSIDRDAATKTPSILLFIGPLLHHA